MKTKRFIPFIPLAALALFLAGCRADGNEVAVPSEPGPPETFHQAVVRLAIEDMFKKHPEYLDGPVAFADQTHDGFYSSEAIAHAWKTVAIPMSTVPPWDWTREEGSEEWRPDIELPQGTMVFMWAGGGGGYPEGNYEIRIGTMPVEDAGPWGAYYRHKVEEWWFKRGEDGGVVPGELTEMIVRSSVQ